MTNHYTIDIYQTSGGKEPYSEWLDSLDKSALARIDARIGLHGLRKTEI